MKKTIYIIRGEKKEIYEEFKERIFNLTELIVNKYNLTWLKFVITENKPPTVSIIPFKNKKIAVISIKDKCYNIIEEIKNEKGYTSFFEVIEALPVSYNKTWEDGKVTPGACLLTLFNKKPSIDYETFFNRWHNGHTPLSLKIHPIVHYNRNVVEVGDNKNEENWDGIVEEHTKTKSELLNPMKFFGNALTMIPNMISVYTDTNSFLDYKTIETYLVTEYYVKTS